MVCLLTSDCSRVQPSAGIKADRLLKSAFHARRPLLPLNRFLYQGTRSCPFQVVIVVPVSNELLTFWSEIANVVESRSYSMEAMLIGEVFLVQVKKMGRLGQNEAYFLFSKHQFLNFLQW